MKKTFSLTLTKRNMEQINDIKTFRGSPTISEIIRYCIADVYSRIQKEKKFGRKGLNQKIK